MSDTSVTEPQRAEREPAPIRPRTYTVDDRGTVVDFQEEAQAVIETTELAVKNGQAQVGDPVIADGRHGAIAQFLFRPARTGKRNSQPGGWDVIVAFPEGLPVEGKFNAADVELRLEEITRPQRPPKSEETTAYGVPTDASFGDEDVKEAADLRQLATRLIQETDDFGWAKTLTDRVVFFWAKKGGSSGGQPKLYSVRFATKHEKRSLGWRVVVTFSADVIRSQLLKQEVIEAIVHESLCQIDRDEHGNLRKLAPHFRGFSTNVYRFGDRVPLVRAAAEILSENVEDIRNLRLDLDAEEADEEIETGV